MRSVGYDIDNVITQTYEFALKIVNKHLGTNYTLDDCLYQTVEECFKLSPEEVASWFRSPESGFPAELLLIDGAKAVINRYHDYLKQHFISARSLSMKDASLDYFDKQGFLYVPERVIFGNNAPEKKAKLAKDLNLDLFTEDDINNANAIAEEAGIPVCILMYKYNRYAIEHRGICKHDLVIPVYEPFWENIEEELKKIL